MKIKGLKKTITFKELVDLLKKDSTLKKPQEKFYRDLANGRILVDNSDYTLIVTGNKEKQFMNKLLKEKYLPKPNH